MTNRSLCAGTVESSNLIVTVLVEQLREAKVAYDLRDEIVALIEQTQATNVVLDLASARFVGSVGFLAFLGVRRHLGNGRIILCNLSDPIREMFAVCRLIQTENNLTAPFEVAASKEAALARLSG